MRSSATAVAVQSYFSALANDKQRWACVIDTVFHDESVQGYWGTLMVALQDMRTTAQGGGDRCYLGDMATYNVIAWLNRNGFRTDGSVVFLAD